MASIGVSLFPAPVDLGRLIIKGRMGTGAHTGPGAGTDAGTDMGARAGTDMGKHAGTHSYVYLSVLRKVVVSLSHGFCFPCQVGSKDIV
jgi:hypothetical protein